MSKSRIDAFSDGVFAIAITLLVINLLPIRSDLAHHWPEYAAFAFSFLSIGVMWVNHHHLMDQLERADRVLLFLNLLLLMGVVVIPFPTILVAQHLTDTGATAAVVAYGLVMIAISLGFAGLWIYVATHATALGAVLPPEALRESIPGFTGGLFAYVVATLIGLKSALAALIIFGLLAVYYLFEHLPSPAEERPPAW